MSTPLLESKISLFSFQVKSLYDTYVQKIPKFANETPTYPSWFEPHVMRWFQEYEENSLTFVENAVKADKQEGVSNINSLYVITTENYFQFAKYGDQPFSISAFDVFCNLHQGYELVTRLHCSDMQLSSSYLYRYAKVVHVVICHYIKHIEAELQNKEGTSTAVVSDGDNNQLIVCPRLTPDVHTLEQHTNSQVKLAEPLSRDGRGSCKSITCNVVT